MQNVLFAQIKHSDITQGLLQVIRKHTVWLHTVWLHTIWLAIKP